MHDVPKITTCSDTGNVSPGIAIDAVLQSSPLGNSIYRYYAGLKIVFKSNVAQRHTHKYHVSSRFLEIKYYSIVIVNSFKVLLLLPLLMPPSRPQ